MLALLLLLSWGAAVPAVAGATTPVRAPLKDAVSYATALTTSDAARWRGTETIVVRNAGTRPLERVWLRLWGNGPVGCAPRAITVSAISGGAAGRLLRDCTALEVLLPQPLARGHRATLALSLTITAPAVQDRFGSAEGIQLFGNALPVVAQRDRGGWRLPPYSSYGESFVSTWAHFSLVLHHPSAISVAASGTTVTTPDAAGSTATTRSELQARDATWVAGTMSEETRLTARGVLVRAWSIPEAGADRSDAAEQAAAAIDHYERKLPAYPYPEYDVVIARIEAGGGMEYPGLVLSDGSDDVTRHEAGHQWFYGLVGNDQYREPWIDEGFTSFLEYSWSTVSELPEPPCYPASGLRVADPSSFVTSTMRYWNSHVENYILAYNNPVCALRSVRARIGTPAFDRVMYHLVADHQRGFLTGAGVRAAFRRAGGQAVDRIWGRWGLAPGRN